MSLGKGVKKGNPIPSGYLEVPNSRNAVCSKCGEEYVIVYEAHEADANLAAQHAAYLSGYLAGEHVDTNHVHLDIYEPLEWSDSN